LKASPLTPRCGVAGSLPEGEVNAVWSISLTTAPGGEGSKHRSPPGRGLGVGWILKFTTGEGLACFEALCKE